MCYINTLLTKRLLTEAFIFVSLFKGLKGKALRALIICNEEDKILL